MMVVPEGGSLLLQHDDGRRRAHGIEHTLPVPNIYDDVIDALARNGRGYTPTLIVGYGGTGGENYWYQQTNVWENERLLKFVPRDVVLPRVAPARDGAGGRVQPRARARRARRRCSTPAAGPARRPRPAQGLGAHWELWMLARAA